MRRFLCGLACFGNVRGHTRSVGDRNKLLWAAPLLAQAATAVILAATALTGCGHNDKSKSSGQVVAKVNNDEITIHQLNFALSRTPRSPDATAEQMQKNALDSLIDQQLLVQYAFQNKLDRDPQIAQAFEMSRAQILAQAALDKLASDKAKPGKDETRGFYAKHPELFEKRKIYSFHQFRIEKPRFSDALQRKLDGIKSPSEVAALLKNEGIAYQEQALTQPAEQWPMEILPAMTKLQKGDIAILSDATRTMLMQLVDTVDEPISETQAAPIIEQYLAANAKKQALEQKMVELKTAAKIVYTAETGNAPAAPATEKSNGDAGHIERGLAGLRK